MGKISRRLFGMSLEEVTFARRGFRGGTPAVRSHIEEVGRSFLAGYHAALAEGGGNGSLVGRLETTAESYRGFTYEGAAMGLALLDLASPWHRRRLRAFLDGPGDAHVYMAHVGAGWAIARLPLGKRAVLARLDPLLRWLAFDGWGFHEGYFHHPRTVAEHAVPARLAGYERRAFDQGVGRSLWFVEGAEVGQIPQTVAGFAEDRRPDLWGGVGLACTYAGGVPEADIEALAAAAGDLRPHLAQGAAFAAKARLRAGNPAPHTEMACRVLCGRDAGEAAAVTDAALEDLPADGDEPAFEVWRVRIREQLLG